MVLSRTADVAIVVADEKQLCVGVFAAKVAALNLLPVPPLAGGRILIELTKKRDSGFLANALTYTGSIVVFISLVWMVVAIVRYFCKAH